MNRMSRFKKILFYIMVVAFMQRAETAVTWIAPSTTPDAIDTNLTIDGTAGAISLQGPVVNISANTVDIAVTLINNPIVQGNLAAPSVLYLNTQPGRTITLNVDAGNDLTFQGSNNTAKNDLLIVHTGNGVVNFSLNSGRTLSFTSSPTTGGTQYYQLMQFTAPVPQTIFFEDSSFSGTLPATVRVGPKSLVGYVAQTQFGSNPQEQGLITFLNNNNNPFSGRFNLDIQDTGAFIVSGVFTSNPLPTLVTIDRSIGAGLNAQLQITHGSFVNPTEGSLLVTNSNNTLSNLRQNPFNLTPNPFDGILYGFIIGANASLDITSNSYLDYVGLRLNQCPLGDGTSCSTISPSSTVKARNPSALIIDGTLNANPALITLEACSALFFRSGVDNNGVVENSITSPLSFTITPTLLTPEQGNIVFDVEGLLNARGPVGSAGLNTKFEILSLFVQPSGGQILIENQNPLCQLVFPLRTFNGAIYNKAAFLVNNSFNLFDTSINHTDQNHIVLNDNDISSQPTYVGGETFLLTGTSSFVPRPRIEFNNSKLYVHTSVALTGVDLVVPNTTDALGNCLDNISNFVFYQNGKACDMGTGRTMILGTRSGSTACDGCTIISEDAHLDVMQETDCLTATTVQQKLLLTTAANDNTIINPVAPCIIDPVAVANQFSVQTIFLGNSSNISVGSQLVGGAYPFVNPTDPKLFIAGNFFSFTTRGGPENTPSISNVTGVGGIFVDSHGTFCICPQYRASVATMVTRSGTGQVNLNKNQVFFDNQIGIADWQLDLTGSGAGVTIIPTGSRYSDYTLNWIATTKDYTLFTPYEVGMVSTCTCPPVVQMNVQALPIIKGEVNQLQIQGSRIGDSSNVIIDGGLVREVIFEILNYSAEAPNGIFILRHFGRLGLGTAHRNPDSLEANIVLGSNGVMIIADGDGVVQVNEDLIINNVCSILRGPNFTSSNILEFTSDTPKSIRITRSGVLDLRQFQLGEKIQFGGQLTIILEPGARIQLANESILTFVDNAQLFAEPYAPYQGQTPPTNDVTATDPIRAKLVGVGILQFSNNATFEIPKNAFVGVETLFELDNNGPCADIVSCGTTAFICEIPVTNIAIFVTDSGRFIVGDNDDATAGAFQVGNTIARTGHSITFTLSLFGPDARAIIKQQGFMGFGVGIVDKRDTPNPISLQGVPNGWKVGSLFNVVDITFLLNQGQFRHDLIYPGNDPRASLLAISNDALFTVLYGIPDPTISQQRTDDLNFNGGGNMILISPQTPTFNPVVTNVNGTVTNSGVIYTVGMLASSFLQDSNDLIAASGTTFFTALSTLDSTLINRCTQLANFAQGFVSFRVNRTQYRAGYIDAGFIGRQDVSDIIDINGGTPGDRRKRAEEIGAVRITLNSSVPAPSSILIASQIQ